MKRLIAAGILLIFIIGFCVTGSIAVGKTYSEFKNKTEECGKIYAADPEGAAELIKEIKKDWEDRENRLSLFVNHEIADDISVALSRAASYAESKCDAAFYAELAAAKTELHQMIEDQKISAHSIF